jgi:PEGA domain
MTKSKLIILVCLITAVLFCVIYFSIRYLTPKPSGLNINTFPASSVYVDGMFVGKTPHKSTYGVGQVNLKLIPDKTDLNLLPYETKINLVSGIQTIVERKFGKTEEDSFGSVISFDKMTNKVAGLTVVSTPTNSQVWIDGTSVGFTPYGSDTLTPGLHEITIKNGGFEEQTFNVKIISGLRLTLYAKLGKSLNKPSTEPVALPTPQSTKTYIIIKDTPTGFLRMRTEPGALGDEIAELKPGEKYLYKFRMV